MPPNLSTTQRGGLSWQRRLPMSGTWRQVCKGALVTPSTGELFNPYLDEHRTHDCEGASAIRRANLQSYLDSLVDRPEVLLLAEAPGPWGCRFSGVPVTSEAQLLSDEFAFRGRQTSLGPEPYPEYTARIFWRELAWLHPNFLIWNTVPLHPHRSGRPLSIRTPRIGEIRMFLPSLEQLVAALAPALILAVGRTAERALMTFGCASTYVRHPSQGGARAFATGVHEALAAWR